VTPDRSDDPDNRSPTADLHVHTVASDGTLTVEELPDAAREAGIDVVAVTDHDRVHPELDAPVQKLDGVTVIRGIELRVDAGDQRLDLLGYGVVATEGLREMTDRIQANRKRRAAAIVDRVEAHVGVEIDVELREGVGRPTIARAIADSDAPYDYSGAFDHLIGADCPCYVAREIPTVADGVEALREACAVVGLAHPFRYPDPEVALDRARELDAVERYYPYSGSSADRADPDRVDAVAAEAGLLRTGGSDAHNRTLGVAGPPAARFEAFADRLPGCSRGSRLE
jgi:predicted metal-dependent phosphoesterase TrpH